MQAATKPVNAWTGSRNVFQSMMSYRTKTRSIPAFPGRQWRQRGSRTKRTSGERARTELECSPSLLIPFGLELVGLGLGRRTGGKFQEAARSSEPGVFEGLDASCERWGRDGEVGQGDEGRKEPEPAAERTSDKRCQLGLVTEGEREEARRTWPIAPPCLPGAGQRAPSDGACICRPRGRQ